VSVLPTSAVLVVTLAVTICAACDVSGVTRTPSSARLTNDLSAPVRVRLCSSDDCRGGFDPPDETLKPGQSWRVNVSSVGVPNVYLVERQNGTRLGCLPLVSPQFRRTEITVDVSAQVTCHTNVDDHTFWPRRWERLK
jgi:hypothetical protein